MFNLVYIVWLQTYQSSIKHMEWKKSLDLSQLHLPVNSCTEPSVAQGVVSHDSTRHDVSHDSCDNTDCIGGQLVSNSAKAPLWIGQKCSIAINLHGLGG